MKTLTELPAYLDTYKEIRAKGEKGELQGVGFQSYVETPPLPVGMNLLQQNGKTEVRTTLLPPLSICLQAGGKTKTGDLYTNKLLYFIRGTRTTLPMAHIYQASGHLCIGSLFLPKTVSPHHPMLPVEVLARNNDRNVSHGNACVRIDEGQKWELLCALPAKDDRELAGAWLWVGDNLIQTDGLYNYFATLYEYWKGVGEPHHAIREAGRLYTEVLFPVSKSDKTV